MKLKYRITDFKNANAEAGLSKTPQGYTWQHCEDETTMELVRTDVHKLFPHTGGFSLYKAGVVPLPLFKAVY